MSFQNIFCYLFGTFLLYHTRNHLSSIFLTFFNFFALWFLSAPLWYIIIIAHSMLFVKRFFKSFLKNFFDFLQWICFSSSFGAPLGISINQLGVSPLDIIYYTTLQAICLLVKYTKNKKIFSIFLCSLPDARAIEKIL